MRHLFYLTAIFFLSCLIAPITFANEQVEEVIIVSDYIPDEKLETSEVADLLDAETIGIAGDSNIGEALKRVPGLSLVGGRFIYVRGLGERYSSTYFNGTPVPSPEPLQRAVPLDLFDASITRNVLVQKTYSPNYGIEFSGGVVDIRSSAVPDENFVKFKIDTGYNSVSTGETGFTYEGGGRDFWGYDDGTRELPAQIDRGLYPEIFSSGGTAERLRQDAARLSFTNNTWDLDREKNPYDIGFSGSAGLRWEASDNISVGGLLVFAHDKKVRNRLINRTRFIGGATRIEVSDEDLAIFNQQRQDIFSNFSVGAADIQPDSVSDYQRTLTEITSNALISIGATIADIHELKLTNLLARKVTDEASLDVEIDSENDVRLNNHRLEWIENELLFNQISGEHFFDAINIKWRYADISANREAPDAKNYVTFETQFNNMALFPDSSIVTSPLTREFTFLDDESDELGLDISMPLFHEQLSDTKLNFGYAKLSKKRRFETLLFEYRLGFNPTDSESALSPEILLDPTSCEVGASIVANDDCFLATNFAGDSILPGSITILDGFFTGSLPDSYNGEVKTEAYYLSIDSQLTEDFRLNFGIRDETSLQRVVDGDGKLFQVAQSGGAIQEQAALIEADYRLASASMTWNLADNSQLRAAYSETVNRPILRELAPVVIRNPEDGEQYIGNLDLLIAEITNVDLRYEYYFAENDYFSLSWFSKSISNPIELFEDVISDETLRQWNNIPSAVNKGVEFELRHYLNPVWYFTTNGTLIDSSVKLNEEIITRFRQRDGRPLQGTSEKLFNFQLAHNSDLWSGSLALNWFSERIELISLFGGEVFEQPFASLDFNISRKFISSNSEYKIGFKLKNLLEEKAEFEYANGLPYDTYKVGISGSLSFELTHY